jgi:hypothetical protein
MPKPPLSFKKWIGFLDLTVCYTVQAVVQEESPMRLKPVLPLVMAAALAGCAAPAPSAPAPLGAASTPAASAVQAPPAALGPLPFRTLVADEGDGALFKAGPSETVVLRSKAELEAFIARHPVAVKPVYGPPDANPYPFPIPPPPAVGAPPSFKPATIPDQVLKLDFGKYEVLAFFDGAVKVASTSRVISVVDEGDHLVATTRRWEPPPNPDAIPDVNARVHLLAVPVSPKPVRFSPVEVVDGTKTDGGSSAYYVGGNPIMRPIWPAVANPELTKAAVEQLARSFARNKDGKMELTLVPISSLPGTFEPGACKSFTPDSLVWYARFNDGAPRAMISPEDGRIMDGIMYDPTP